MADEPTHADILGAVRGIEATLTERRRAGDQRQRHLESDLTEIKASQHETRAELKEQGGRLRKLEETAASGKSALATSLKIGGALAVLAAGAAWVWEKFLKYIPH